MTYNLVVHMTECKPQSTVASARVAKFIADTLIEDRFNLVDTCDKAKQALYNMPFGGISNLIIVNGPMAFCDFLPELGELVMRSKEVIWVQQDYTIMPPTANSRAISPFRRAFAERKLRPTFWTTVQANVQEPGDQYINWNQLTYDPQPRMPLSVYPVLLYYGAYREKRELDFKFYFKDAPYEVRISTTPIRAKKFLATVPNAQIVPPFTRLGSMPLCSASLYIEDYKSHIEFHSPANRFYELLSAGIPILFDIRTLPMLAKAGIVPEPGWVVDSQDKVQEILTKGPEHMDMIRKQQFVLWGEDYVGDLKNRLRHIWVQHTQGEQDDV